MQLKAFSDAHGRPQERFFNLLCMAYGANQTVFADLVDKGYLLKDRAMGCPREYRQLTFALQTLILPHIDQDVAKTVLDESWQILAPRYRSPIGSRSNRSATAQHLSACRPQEERSPLK